MPPKKTPVDRLLSLLALQGRIQHRASEPAVRMRLYLGAAMMGVSVVGVLLWWALFPSLLVQRALHALDQGDGTVLRVLIDEESVVDDFYEEWSVIAAMRGDGQGTPRAISLSVKPEAVERLLSIFRRELANIERGQSDVFHDVQVEAAFRFRFEGGLHEVPLTLRSASGAVYRFHAEVKQEDMVAWRITALPGSVMVLAALVDEAIARERAQSGRPDATSEPGGHE